MVGTSLPLGPDQSLFLDLELTHGSPQPQGQQGLTRTLGYHLDRKKRFDRKKGFYSKSSSLFVEVLIDFRKKYMRISLDKLWQKIYKDIQGWFIWPLFR